MIEPANAAELALRGKWADLLPTIPEGQNYLWHSSRGGGVDLFGWRTRYWSFLLKLAKDKPAWTVQARPGSSTGPFHWNNRYLSTEELLRIQTFPLGYSVEGSRASAQRQIGNAVPSAIGEMLGKAIADQILGRPVSGRLKLLPPEREDCPKPELVGFLPARYRSFIGAHPDHPGVGLGPGASVA